MNQFLATLLAWFSSFLNWAALRTLLIEFLRSAFVKAILLRWLGSAASGTYKAWIAKVIVEYAFNTLALPIVQLTFRKMGYAYHRIEGQIIFKRIEDAKASNDQEKYDKAVDDLFRN